MQTFPLPLSKAQMRHRHYHEVEGRDAARCGHELGRMFGPIVRDYLAEARSAGSWNRRKRQAAAFLDATIRYFPAYAPELQAYAAAARVALLDLWTMSVAGDLDDDGCEDCTTMVVNGGRSIGHNEDWDRHSSEDICILRKKCGDVTTLELYYYACPLGGTALTVSSAGCIQAINSLPQGHRPMGVPKIVLARRLSEMRSPGTEVPGVLSVPRSSGFAHTLLDHAGRLTSLEMTADNHVVWQPRIPFVHTNHVIGSGLRTEGANAERSTFVRYETACRRVSASMTRAELVSLLSDVSCGERLSIFNRDTIARGIVDLNERAAWFWLRREAGLGWIRYDIDFFPCLSGGHGS
jgi:hypothetical protein